MFTLPGIGLEEPILHRSPVPDVATDERTSQLTVEAEERVIQWLEHLASYRDNHVLRGSGPPPIEVNTSDAPYRAPIYRGHTTRVGISPLTGRVPSATAIYPHRPINLYAPPLAGHHSLDHFAQWSWPCHGLSISSPPPLGGNTRATNNGGKVFAPSARCKTTTDSAVPPPTFSKVICPPHPRTNNGPGQAGAAPPRHADIPAFVYREGMYSLALAPEGDQIDPVPPRRRVVYPIVQQELGGNQKEIPSASDVAAVARDRQTADEECKTSSVLTAPLNEVVPVSPSHSPRSKTDSTQPVPTLSDRRSSSLALTPTDDISLNSRVRRGRSVFLAPGINGCEGDGSYIASVEEHLPHPQHSVERSYGHLVQIKTKQNIHKTTESKMEGLNARDGILGDPYALRLLPWCLKEEFDISD